MQINALSPIWEVLKSDRKIWIWISHGIMLTLSSLKCTFHCPAGKLTFFSPCGKQPGSTCHYQGLLL